MKSTVYFPTRSKSSVSFSALARNRRQTRAVIGDILVAMAWGATIPGLMWLGAAVGF